MVWLALFPYSHSPIKFLLIYSNYTLQTSISKAISLLGNLLGGKISNFINRKNGNIEVSADNGIDQYTKEFDTFFNKYKESGFDDAITGLNIPAEYTDNLKQYVLNTKEANQSTKGFQQTLVATGKAGAAAGKNVTATSKAISGVASVGKAALGMFGNIALNLVISEGLQLAANAWDNYANQQENAIERGNAALQEYENTQQTIQSTKSWIDENADRYAYLAQRATRTGEQGRLTDSEFEEYNTLSSQISEYLPDQITGYNSLGTAIMGTVDSVQELNNAFTDEKISKYSDSVSSFGEVIAKVNAEMFQDKTNFTKESGITNQMDAIDELLSIVDRGEIEDFLYNAGAYTVDGLPNAGSSSAVMHENLKEAMRNAGIEGSGFLGAFTESDYTDEENLATLRNYTQTLQQQAESSAQSVKQMLPAFLQVNEDYQGILNEIPEMDSLVNTMIQSFSSEDLQNLGIFGEGISAEEGTKAARNWASGLIKELQNEDAAQAFQDLFTLDEDKYGMSYAQYEEAATDAIDNVADRTDSFTKQQLKDSAGVTDSLDEMATAYNDIYNKFGKDSGFSEDYLKNTMSTEDLLTLADIANDESFVGDYQTALKKITEVQEKAKLSVDSLKQSVVNARTAFSSISSAMEEAQTASGLTDETVTSLMDSFANIEDVNDSQLNNLFQSTADGVKLNYDALESLAKTQHDISTSNFTKSLTEQNKAISEQSAEVKKLMDEYGADSPEYQNAVDDLLDLQNQLEATYRAQSEYAALYKQQQELFSDFNQWQIAQSTENAGAHYDALISGLETAKDAYDKGLTGTDDFKTFAAYLSPSGSDDPENFAENYSKAARYITEDASGVQNFLHDLASKGFAELNQATQEWKLNLEDVEDTAQAMGMGEDWFGDMLGKLEDYGMVNNFVESVEDGMLKQRDLRNELVQAEMDRIEMERTGANQTALEAKDAEIAQLRNSLSETQKATQQEAVNQARKEAEGAQIAVDQIKTAKESMDEALKSGDTGLANAYAQQIQALAEEYDIPINLDNFVIDEAALNEKFKNVATPENPIKPEYITDTQNYESALGKVQEAWKQNNSTLKESVNTLAGYNSEQLRTIQLNDGAYDSEELKPAEQALDSITQALGLSNDEAAQLVGTLEAMGLIQPEIDMSALQDLDIPEDLKVKIQAQLDQGTTVDQLLGMKDEELASKLEIDTSEVDEARSALETLKSEMQTFNNMEGSTSTINLDLANTQAVEEANTALSQMPQSVTTTIVTSVSGEEELTTLTSTLESIPDNTPTTVTCDVSSAEDLNTLQAKVDELNSSGKNITLNATLKADKTDLSGDLNSENVSIDAKATITEVDTEGIETPTIDVKGRLTSVEQPPTSILNPNTSPTVEQPQTLTGGTAIYEQKVEPDTPKPLNGTGTAIYRPDVNDVPPPITGGVAHYNAVIDNLNEAGNSINVQFVPVHGEVDAYIAEEKQSEGIVNWSNNTGAVDSYASATKHGHGIVTWGNDTSAVKTNFSAIGTVNWINANESFKSAPVAAATGTMLSPARASGTAYNILNMHPISNAHAKGDVALPRNEEALVNEVGTESIIRNGQWFLIPGGMHRENLKKGDIILSASQTEDLLTRGRAIGHGRAYANGTTEHVRDYITPRLLSSYASGSGTLKFSGGAATSSGSSSSAASTVSQSATQAASAVSDASESVSEDAEQSITEVSDALQEIIDHFTNFFDFAERSINNIERNIEKYQILADGSNTMAGQNKQYDAMISSIQELRKTYTAAIAKYEAVAADVANRVGISQDLMDKVRNGTINVEELSADDKARVEAYAEWVDKAEELKNDLYQLRVDERDAMYKKLDVITEHYEALVDKYEARADKYGAKVSWMEATGQTRAYVTEANWGKDTPYINALQEQRSAVGAQYKLIEKELALYTQRLKEMQQSADFNKANPEYQKALAKKAELEAALYENKEAYHEFTQAIREARYSAIEVAIDGLKRVADRMQAAMDYFEEVGSGITEHKYNNQIANNSQRIIENNRLIEEKRKELVTYEYNSEEYQRVRQEISDLNNEIIELATNNERIKKQIRELRWQDFTSGMENIDNMISDIEHAQSLINEDNFLNDDGTFTSDDAPANLLLLAKGIELNNQKIAEYRTALEKLQQELDNGVITQEQYNEESAQFIGIIQDSATAIQGYKDEILDMYISQCEKLNEILQENIDLRQEALEKMEDYYDYDRNLKDQTKDIDNLRAQIAALSGVILLARVLFNCGKIPITLSRYNVTGNGKRECGTCL